MFLEGLKLRGFQSKQAVLENNLAHYNGLEKSKKRLLATDSDTKIETHMILSQGFLYSTLRRLRWNTCSAVRWSSVHTAPAGNYPSPSQVPAVRLPANV